MAPPNPQALSLVPIRHVVPEQQPAEQEVASQTQAPATHRCPTPQAAEPPHWQTPDPEQVSVLAGSQVAQARPPLPQLPALAPGKQVLPEQQPAQEVGLHTHAPALHCWPALQAGPLPHWQAPLVEQVSARTTSHATQAAPLAPQVATERVWQVAPEQQPLAQLAAVQPEHTPLLQTCAPGQAWQAAPADPHAESRLPGRQVFPAQQPVGHEVLSHWQVPPTQR